MADITQTEPARDLVRRYLSPDMVDEPAFEDDRAKAIERERARHAAAMARITGKE